LFFFSSRRRHTRSKRDWSSDVCSSDLRALSLFERLIADGQAALVVLEFTALTLPVVIALVLPVAGFAATVYGINRLSGDSEMVRSEERRVGEVGRSRWSADGREVGPHV